jgi:hypothetical protein
VRLDHSPNGVDLESALNDLITVEAVQENTIRYLTDDPLINNPHLVRRLDGLGFGLVELRELSASLEDVYLNIVAGADR